MVSSCKLHQHYTVRWDQLPSPNEVKIKFVLANKENLLISLNLCQNILCSIDQRNTHSMQTCSTSKKECFYWHRAHLLFSCISSCEPRSMQKCSTASQLSVCTMWKWISTHSLSGTIINHQCKHRIIHHLQCLPTFTAKSVRSITLMFVSFVSQNKIRILKNPNLCSSWAKTQFELNF